MVSLSNLIVDYRSESEGINDRIYDLSYRMREQGYDGDHDPLEPHKRRIEEIEILQHEFQRRLSEIKLTDEEAKVVSEIHSFFEVKAEVEAEAAHERRQLGCY